MLEFSRFMLPETKKTVSFIVLSPASSTVKGTLGKFNESWKNEWVICEVVRWDVSHLGLGSDEGAGLAFLLLLPLYVFSKSFPGTFKIILDIEVALCSFNILLCTLFHLILQISHLVMSDSLRPHGLQHTRPPCPWPSPGVYSNSCPLSW